jgi:DNA-binding response OmpR family regulator
MAGGQNRNILIVEDDTDFRHTLAEQLRFHEKFDVEEAGTGAAALAGAVKNNYNAILLDVGLPDMDSRDVCRLLRRKGVYAPVIMLTALDGDADNVLGLDSGANKAFPAGRAAGAAAHPYPPARNDRGRVF